MAEPGRAPPLEARRSPSVDAVVRPPLLSGSGLDGYPGHPKPGTRLGLVDIQTSAASQSSAWRVFSIS